MPDNERERSVVAKMPASLHRRVRVRCVEMGISVAELVRYLLQEWLAGRIEYQPAEELQTEQ